VDADKANDTIDAARRLQRARYRAATASPERRFHARYATVSGADILARAWGEVAANGGAAGVDGQAIGDVQRRRVAGFPEQLGAEPREGRYRPRPVRRVRIPKADGKQRPLGIPTVRDRVVQAAAKVVLEPIFEADFRDSSYGFRNGTGKTTLLHILANALNRSVERFAFLQFDQIALRVAGRTLRIARTSPKAEGELSIALGRKKLDTIAIEEAIRYATGEADEETRRRIDQIKRSLPFAPPSYFPAFRTMIEAWSSMESEAHSRTAVRRQSSLAWTLAEREIQPTVLARSLLGDFVPDIRYPAPLQIERELSAEARSAALFVAEQGRFDLSRAFVKVIESILSGAPDLAS
jgi:Reverse transcriptase (RNA-dependent DNA polymerase)